tara:strand:+ start:984 stop:1874 length:891 start_codon:yes stop_codon:yes gene_type:complete
MSRKAPSESATNFSVGKKMRGNDGNIWIIVKTSNGVQRWKLHKKTDVLNKTKKNRVKKRYIHSKRRTYKRSKNNLEKNLKKSTIKPTEKKAPIKGKKYFTHDNGGRPFMVVINGNKVDIYTYSSNFNFERDLLRDDYDKHIKGYKNIHKKFIGKSIKGDDATNLPSSFGLGNTILLKITKNKYVFIGSTIYEFEPEDEIKEYYSMIGNSDVPYPVAIGEKNVYFLIESTYLSKDYFYDFPKKYSWGLDAYPRLYGSLKFVPKELKDNIKSEKLIKVVSLENKSKKISKIKIVSERI